MDFVRISTKETKGGGLEVYPDFVVGRSKDLMVRGRSFYAIWDEEAGLWSTDEYDVQRLVDAELRAFAERADGASQSSYDVKYLRSANNGGWYAFRKFMQNISDNSHDLDATLIFANTEVKKNDYASRRLPYPLARGDHSAWDELVGTLYSVEERAKIEWAIGAIVSGDSKRIQKFLVFYGLAGTGKSTIMNIIEKMFAGYTTTFEAKALGGNNNAFATEVFKNNPLVAIQQDGDLSMIEDNTKLNSIIAHEPMTMNEKFKPSYTGLVHAFLIMGTNRPVKITDAKSGLIRRLIDVHPTGVKIPENHYHTLMSKIDFELGAIAHHCLDVYHSMGRNYYSSYRPTEMMLQTDVFFNYIEHFYDVFKAQDGVTLRQAYNMYKEFCEETGIEKNRLPQYKFREELRNYFDEFRDRAVIDGAMVRSYYSVFNANKFKAPVKKENAFAVVMEDTVSLLDEEYEDQPAQYASEGETPLKRWANVTTTLKDIDTNRLHFVKVPEGHIIIDFDLKDENGEKSLEQNLRAASVWPATYAELSKSGNGVHLHYIYEGDTSELNPIYSEGIEVKVYTGDSSLRRRLSKCNNTNIATINSGLPLKEKKMLGEKTIKSERGLRDLIERNLQKEFGGTKTSVDFIAKILNEAYESGMSYDVTDMRGAILAFANNSTNQSLLALKTVQGMKFKGGEVVHDESVTGNPQGESFHKAIESKNDTIVFYDVEVYPNLFVICWKYRGSDTTVRMVNPSPEAVQALFDLKLVGFYNRRYDNHIIYAAAMGYSNEQLYQLSQKMINGTGSFGFGEAYNLSYADIWEFSAKRQTLKLFEIELGIKHMEMNLPWDQPVPEELWDKVVDYCVNDVEATEAVFENRYQDFVARQILADLSGLSINSTTPQHTAKILFGNDRNAQRQFVYTKLDRDFPGYEYDFGKSTYRGETVGEGGYVYAEPGMYENVVTLDVASMHPTSIVNLNLFGEYTKNYKGLLDARIAIKHGDFESARKMLGGKLAPHLKNEDQAEALSYALKIALNIVYGLTSAKFDNPFRDTRNKDNIVAKRGALFMIDLKHFVQERGFQVVHIKTDSIKVVNPTAEILEEITLFGEKWGYAFEVEDVYERFCLVNDAVYIAKKAPEQVKPGKSPWTATGAQFAHPYVFKTLFTKEEPLLEDHYETKSVQKGSMHLDFSASKPMFMKDSDDSMVFVGRTGRFVPVTESSHGGVLYRIHDDKLYAVAGTKGYLWLEAETVDFKDGNVEIDTDYFEKLASKAVETIEKFGNFEHFVRD